MGMHRIRTKVARPPPKPAPLRRGPVLRLDPALKVGAVNDPAEREAETMAARVMGASAPGHAPNAQAAAPSLRREADQPNLDEVVPEPAPAEHADFELPDTQDVASEQLSPSDTAEIDSGQPVDTAGDPPAPDSPPLEDAPLPVLASRAPEAVVGRMGGAAPADVANIVANPGPGRPLPSGLRARVEPHFNRSFEDTRLHDGPRDRDAAARIGARAFTHRNHIWLGPGESPTNTRLMAHEMTHVVQQMDGAEALPLRRIGLPEIDIELPGKGWIEEKLEYVPGYKLMTVMFEKTLVTGERVVRNARNLLEAIFKLHPLGTALWNKLEETNMIDDAFTWVSDKLKSLDLTWSRLTGFVSKLTDILPTTSPVKDAIAVFKPLSDDLIAFAKAVGLKVLELAVKGALKLAGPYADKVWGVLQQAGDVIHLIYEKPLDFAKNLIKAIVGGFRKFKDNIVEHLKKGLLGWLFGAIASAGITMPAKLDFKGIMSLVMQILGLTYAAFRKDLVKRLGPSGEKKVSMIEKSVEIVKLLLVEGFAGIWRKIVEMIEGFKEKVIGGIQDMVITTVVKAAVSWLAGLSNPVGAVVKVVLSIYEMIVTFLERLEQIMDVAKSIFSSVGAIAKGQTEAAATFIEQTIGRTVPVALSFLAAAMGLNTIPSKIRGIIKKLQAPVAKVRGKLIDLVLKKAKKIFAGIIGKLNARRKLPSANFKIGAMQHRIFGKKQGKKVEVMLSSTEGTVQQFEDGNAAEMANIKDKDGLKIATALQSETEEADQETGEKARKTDPTSEKQNNLKSIKELKKELEEAAREMEEKGRAIDQQPAVSSQVTGRSLFRAAEPRSEKYEGVVGSYADLVKDVGTKSFSSQIKLPVSKFYEMDHTIEKQFPHGILERLHLLSKDFDDAEDDTTLLRGARKGAAAKGHAKKASVANAPKTPIGELGASITKIDETANEFPAIALYHRNHIIQKGKNLPKPAAIIEEARAEKTEAKRAMAVRRALKAQLNAEEIEMKSLIDKDPQIQGSEVLKANFAKGLEKLRSLNYKKYNIGKVGATPRDHRPEDISNAGTGSDFAFGGEGKFDEIEGQGVLYGDRQRGLGDFFEYDHVLDKAFPKDAAKQPFLTADQKAQVAAALPAARKAREDQGETLLPLPAQERKLALLGKARLFDAASSIGTYTDDAGYSIPLYLPVANEVTSRVKTPKTLSAAPVMATLGADTLNNLVSFVLTGDMGARESARDDLHTLVHQRFRERTDTHASPIKSLYAKQIDYVREINGGSDAAAAKMRAIKSKVEASLVKASQETHRLF